MSGFKSANSARSPTDKKLTKGQKRISKRVKTFLLVMTQFLNAKALAFVISSCKSDKHVFKIGLLNGKVMDENTLADDQIQNMGQSFAMIIDKNVTRRIPDLKAINALHGFE
jgi:hypothetical protein